MSDFWRGMLALPVAAVAVAVIAAAVFGLAHAYWNWSGEYWFRIKPAVVREPDITAHLASLVFISRRVRRIRLFPGCLILICRDYAYHSDGVDMHFFEAKQALLPIATKWIDEDHK